uniref:GHMP_kinases_N domain-containing protein n=1 Tax=Heligmosomoides polygyrus TaxID=6339 RepID=A0A8L8JZS6_HELPZ
LDSPGGSCSRASNHASPMRNLSSAHGGLYVSAPGKIILFGEHAVVYGRTAIAGSIDLRTYVSLFTSADGRIYLSLPDLGVEKTWLLKDLIKAADRLAAEHPVEEDLPPSLELLVPIARKLSGSCEDQCGVQHLAILAFWYLLLGVAHRKRDILAVKATVRFKLPSCVGLGSSGAYCVCIATALLQTSGLIPSPSIVTDEDGSLTWEDQHLDMIRKWATAAESLIHGRASGLDAAVCTYGTSDASPSPYSSGFGVPERFCRFIPWRRTHESRRFTEFTKESSAALAHKGGPVKAALFCWLFSSDPLRRRCYCEQNTSPHPVVQITYP